MRNLYKVILSPADQGYMVTVPDFGCNTQGKDIADALRMARDVIKTMSSTLKGMGKDIPEPDSVDFKAEPEDIVTYVDVDFIN